MKKEQERYTEKHYIRVTPSQKLELKGRAKNAGLSIAEYSRRAIFNQTIYSRLTPTEEEYFKLLKQRYNEFVNIKNHWSISGERLKAVDTALKEIKDLLNVVEI